nr:ABC transporter substrate-binding protein [uncultured Desulfuromonas sp.]
MSDTGTTPPAGTRLVTDMAGRKVIVKEHVEKVFGYNPMITALMYALAPEKIAGHNFPPSPLEQEIAPQSYLELPVLGVLGALFGGGKQTLNTEAIRQARPDVILSMTLSKIDEPEVQMADNLQKELDIPVLIYDGALERSAEVIRRVGLVIGAADRAEALADYFDKKFDIIQRTVASIAKSARHTVYYAQTPSGLQTEPRGARHGEIIDLAGGINCAETYELRGCGRTPISADDLLRWDPEVILVMSDEGNSEERLLTRMADDPFWSCLKAVKNGTYYEPPGLLYSWFDRPPSINRLMGLIWLTGVLYPEQFNWDMTEEVRSFYHLFYRMDLSDEQIGMILATLHKKTA